MTIQPNLDSETFTLDQFSNLFLLPSEMGRVVRSFLVSEDRETAKQAYKTFESAHYFEEIGKLGLVRYDVKINLEQTLGSGGSAKVYEATNPSKQSFACKILTSPVYELDRLCGIAKNSFESALKSEAKLSKIPKHPNLGNYIGIAYDEAIHTFGSLYELIEAKPLNIRTWNAMEIALRASKSIRVMLDIAKALQALEKAGIAHCDVVSANIMILKEGRAKLIDFEDAFYYNVDKSDRNFNEENYSKFQKRLLMTREAFGDLFIRMLVGVVDEPMKVSGAMSRGDYSLAQEFYTSTLLAAGIPVQLAKVVIDCSYFGHKSMKECSWHSIIDSLESLQMP